MTEYDGGKRPLSWELQNALVFSQTTEDDIDCESASSFVWPADSDERVVIPFKLSLNEYNVLASAIDVGSDIAYGEDALRVVWLWLRNFRCEVPNGGNDMACCGPSITDRLNTTTYINDYYTQYQATEDQYDIDGLDTIAPNMNPLSTSQGNIDQMMCAGWRIILTTIIKDVNAIKALNAEQKRDMIAALGAALGALAGAGGVGLGLGGVTAATVAFFGGPWLVLGLGLATVGLAIAGVIAATTSDQINDSAAFEALLCHINENTVGTAPSFEWFANAINLEGLANDTPEYALATVVSPYLQDLNVFLQFMVNMSLFYDVLDWSILPETCACDSGATVELIALPGWPASSLVYDGVDGLDDVYIITPINTGHYSVMGFQEKDGDPFLIMDVTAVPDAHGGYFAMSNGSFLTGDVPDDLPVTVVGVYKYATTEVITIKVRPAT